MTKTIIGIEVVDVEKRRVPSKHYVYVIVVKWTDGSSMVIYRRYSRFFDLQTQLLDKFPIEAGATDPALRIIPFLPGKIFFGRSHIRDVAMKRLGEIDTYCKSLLSLPPHISQSEEVLEFFEVEPEDLDPPTEDPSQRHSSLSLFGRSGAAKGEKKGGQKISGPKRLDRYVAVADYSAQEKGEMDLTAGMSLEVTEKSESGWWFVNAEEQQGWVPSTYLQPVNGSSSTQDSVQDGHEEKYICIEKFGADNDDEVSLEKGVIVEVLQKNMDGWWTVRYQGVEGLAPATYLKRSTDPYAQSLVEKSRQSGVQIIGNLADVSTLLSSSSSSTPRNSLAVSSASPRNSAILGGGGGGGGGDDGGGGGGKEEEEWDEERDVMGKVGAEVKPESLVKVVLKQRSLERGGSLKPPPRQSSVQQLVVSPPPPSPTSKPSTYVTVAEFEDTVGDGISFTVGETVTVLEKTGSGWWFVERGQDQGWVPESYLQQNDAPPITQADSVEERGDTEDSEEDEESEEEESDEERALPPSSSLASALNSRLKGVNGDQRPPGGPPKPPSKAGFKPPTLPGKPLDTPHSDASHGHSRDKASAAPLPQEKEAPSGGLASALKSRFESKPTPPGVPGKPGGVVSKPGPPAPPAKPGDKPGPLSLPSKPSGRPVAPSKPGEKAALPALPADRPAMPVKQIDKPKPPGKWSKPSEKPGVPGVPKKPEKVEDSGPPGGVTGIANALKSKFEQDGGGGSRPFQTSKPSPPSKPFGGEGSTKPGIPHKPTQEVKPTFGQKPALPFKKAGAAGDEGKPSAPPTKGLSGPPRLPVKPHTGAKPALDSNNNTGGGGTERPVSSKIHDLAAAFSKLDAGGQGDLKDAKPRPSPPFKKPSPPAQKPGNARNSAAVPGAAAATGKPRVGNLVSELSGKLQFGGGGGGGGGGGVGGGGGGGITRSPEPSPVGRAAPWSTQTRGDNTTNSISSGGGGGGNRMSHTPAPPPPPSAAGPLQPPKPMQSLLAKPPPAPSLPEYEAVADFEAEGDGEVYLQCGDVVGVVDSSQEDWWLVRRDGGQEGWVPSSYLEPAPQWDD